MQGFIYRDFDEQRADFFTEAGAWLREGLIRYREDVVEGLQNAPEAFVGLLKGRNFGKLLVKVESSSAESLSVHEPQHAKRQRRHGELSESLPFNS